MSVRQHTEAPGTTCIPEYVIGFLSPHQVKQLIKRPLLCTMQCGIQAGCDLVRGDLYALHLDAGLLTNT